MFSNVVLRFPHFCVLHVDGLLLEDDVVCQVGVVVRAAVVLNVVLLHAGRNDFDLESQKRNNYPSKIFTILPVLKLKSLPPYQFSS